MGASTYLDRLIDLALDEDLGAAGDVTTLALVAARAQGRGELWAKESMVLSGLDAFERVFTRFDARVQVKHLARDGELVPAKARVAVVLGPLRSLLTAERVALNFIQRTCGIATLAHSAQQAVKGSKLVVLDTRKTAPGMRALSKGAVRDGGAGNHRFGLFDGVLIKDNHLAAVGGSVATALRLARELAPRLAKIELEVTTLAQLKQALAAPPDVVMLDNMTDEQIRAAVRIARGRVKLEVSGNVTLERLTTLARTGVDYVSMGSLTHSARAMDLSLEIEPVSRRLPRRASLRA